MRNSSNAIKIAASLLLASLALSGCGKKDDAEASAKAAAKAFTAGKVKAASANNDPPPLPSVAGKLDKYTPVEMSAEIDQKGWLAYRDQFAHALAAIPDISDRTLAEAGIAEIGAEPDSFKREDLIKAQADAIKALRKSATPKLHISWGSQIRGSMPYATVSPYDQETQSYKIQIQPINGYMVGRAWQTGATGAQASAAYRVNLVGIASSQYPTAIVKKIPPDQARGIEAQLARLRQDASAGAILPISVYGTVAGSNQTAWNLAVLDINADAIALHMPKEPLGAPTILIDGPEIKAPQRP